MPHITASTARRSIARRARSLADRIWACAAIVVQAKTSVARTIARLAALRLRNTLPLCFVLMAHSLRSSNGRVFLQAFLSLHPQCKVLFEPIKLAALLRRELIGAEIN